MARLLPSDPPFENYTIYGPYNHPNRGKPRRIVFLVAADGRTSMSYARYLVSVREGRWLSPQEQVDHKDDDRLNDELGNLQILTPAENVAKGRSRAMITLICPNCGAEFTRERRQTHLVQGGNPTCCSRSCGGRQGYRRRAK